MRKISKTLLILLFGIGILIFIYFFTKNSNKSNPRFAAIVNETPISKDELNKNISFTKNFYTFSKQNLTSYSTLQKDILDRLVEDKLVEEYASNHNIKVTDNEITKLYEQKISKNGEDQLLAQLKQMYGMNKSDYLEVLKMDLLREKVQAAVKMPLLEWLKIEKNKADITNFTN